MSQSLLKSVELTDKIFDLLLNKVTSLGSTAVEGLH